MTTVLPPPPSTCLENKVDVLQQQHDDMSSSNVNHLALPSSMAPEKSVSSTLAERRRLPISPEKLKLYSQIKNQNQPQQQPQQVLKRLEEENAKLPTQVSLKILYFGDQI